MKNKKNANRIKNGISLIVLVIIAIVMSILVGMTVVSTEGIFQETKAREFASELKQLEHLVKQSKILSDNKNLNFVERTIAVSNLTTEQQSQMSEEIDTNATQIKLYELDFDAINVNDTTYGKKENGDTNDVYVVSYKTGKIYYLKGYVWEGNTYYTLTGELNKFLSIQ